MTLERLIELYQAEQAGKQIMAKTIHFGYSEYRTEIKEVNISDLELYELVLAEVMDCIHTTFFIKGEE